MSTLFQVLVGSLLALVVLSVSVGAVLRWVVRRVRRSVSVRMQALTSSRPGGRAGRSIPARGAEGPAWAEYSTLGIRVRASLPGPARQVAVIRRELTRDLRGAERAVAAGREAQRPVEGLHTVMVRLAEQARALDVDLAIISNEPDRKVRQELLATQQDRLKALGRGCAEIRRAVLLSGPAGTANLLRSVENDLNDEVIGLALRARAYAELTDL